MNTRLLVALLVITTWTAWTTSAPAWGQSKRYPAVAPDKEAEADRSSSIWEAALHPDRAPYDELVRDAQKLWEHGTADDIQAAFDKLDAAIKRMPKHSEAYLVRGRYYAQKQQWAACADDLGRSEDASKLDDNYQRTQVRIELGMCQARAGRYADAERTLVRAAATAQAPIGDLWRSLGEVRIALGKLDEAIDALEVAIESASDITAYWLLAMAYDRARRTNDAEEAARMAHSKDPSVTWIDAKPLLGTGDKDYILGLANRYGGGIGAVDSHTCCGPELALIYFRHYITVAPKSPWRHRAEEHIRDLSALKLPAANDITLMSNMEKSRDAVRAAAAKAMPQMRACLAKLPGALAFVSVTKVGPRSPESPDRPVYRTQPAGATVKISLTFGDPPKAEIDVAQRCVQQIAEKIAMPAIKDKDSYYIAQFNVVSR